MGFLLAKLLPALAMPLGLALLMQLGGLLGRGRRWGPWLSGGGLLLLWLAAMPLVSRALIRELEARATRMEPAVLPRADVVLVLGGGLRPALAPRPGVEVGEAGDRLLRGVELMRRGKAPRLVLSGGRTSLRKDDPAPPEARSAASLARWLGVSGERIVLSETARTTAEEARALEALARRRGWRSVLLVTSATHLPRSVATFRRLTTLRITPVACDYLYTASDRAGTPTLASGIQDLLPDAGALNLTSVAVREGIGLIVYRLRGWV